MLPAVRIRRFGRFGLIVLRRAARCWIYCAINFPFSICYAPAIVTQSATNSVYSNPFILGYLLYSLKSLSIP